MQGVLQITLFHVQPLAARQTDEELYHNLRMRGATWKDRPELNLSEAEYKAQSDLKLSQQASNA